MKFLIALLAFISGAANAYVSPGDQHALNRFHSTAHVHRLGSHLYQAQQHGAKAVFDVSVNGGAVGDHAFRFDGKPFKLPDNAIVLDCFLDIVSSFTSSDGTGTLAVKVASAADLMSATDADTITVAKDCTGPDGTFANRVKLSAEGTVEGTVATEALTAGKANLFITYVLSD